MTKCTRNFYDESVRSGTPSWWPPKRATTRPLASSIRARARGPGKKAAIIGGGPTGISAAYFLGRAGIDLHDL
jgi:putative selenate reductase